MNSNVLYDNSDEIISYVTSKIKKFEPQQFEQQVKYYINEYCNKYLHVTFHPSIINDFFDVFYDNFRDIVKENEHQRELEMKWHRMADYEIAKKRARDDLISKIYKNKNKTSLNETRKLALFQPLLDEDIVKIYYEYEREWYKVHPPNGTKQPKPKKETFSDKLDRYIVEHMEVSNNLMSFDEFKRVTLAWNRGQKSLEQYYEEYKKKYYEQPGTTVTYKFNDTGLIGYKGKDKIKTLMPMFPNKQVNENKIKSSFNLKSNIKDYQLHKCTVRNTWIIDFMFCDKLAYLVAINANTKYLFVELVNKKVSDEEYAKGDLKSAVSYLNALNRMIDKGMTVKHLTGDGEKAFVAHEVMYFYQQKGIDFKPVPRQVMGVYPDFMRKEQNTVKSDPLHGSLGIVDRIIRTIRDMAYVMKVGVITPNVMNDIVKQYNHAPHKGLSKWAGFSVTPKMVNDDPELEEYIVRKICQENYNIMNRAGFKLNGGTHVKVYNEKDSMNKRRSIIQPGDFVINGFRNGLYEVEGKVNGKNTIQMIPRYKLDPI